MSDADRPDPDALLKAIQKEEAKSQRGNLKIFFGMVAGVGKTYAMLEAARQRLAEGIDVVVGYVETHGRAETEEMLAGLPFIPRKRLDYRGTQLEEMDIDAILERAPQLVLVDELAHTNAVGSRHPKRYQDVLELLDAGINVYTTLNVQHIESRADAVRQITGVTVHETVPDSILDTANEIELIDLPPDELLKRLSEGKVYTPDRAELAAQKFFRKGNLTALREMSLRLTAERVDHQLQDYMQVKQIAGPWKSGERLMVALSPSPLSERLVRWTRRMAYNLEAEWLAVSVESPIPLSDDQQQQLAKNMALARELGGEVVVTAGTDIVKSLLRVARQRNVTQIVIGKPQRDWLQEKMSGGSLVNRLVHHSGSIDVYVVTGDPMESRQKLALPIVRISSNVNQYVIASVIIVSVVILNLVLFSGSGYYEFVGLNLLLTVLILSAFVGRGPIFLASTLSAILWDLLFIPPRYTITISRAEDVLVFIMYFVIALVTGNLTTRFREQERAAISREKQTNALYTMSREIANTLTLDDVLNTAVQHIGQIFDADVVMLLQETGDGLSHAAHKASTFLVNEKEWSVALWAYENGKTAGRFTDTLPSAQGQYWPLVAPSGIMGVIGIRFRSDERLLTNKEVLLATFVNQVSLAIEREAFEDKLQHTAVLEESERLYATLLDSISHELRTPLAAIRGAASGLLDPTIRIDDTSRQTLEQDMQDALDRLTRLVDNLLDMTRLESGQLKLRLDWCDVTDLINVSLQQVEKRLINHQVIVEVADHLPLIRLDFVLMEQVLVNLLHNAATYAPPKTRVRIGAHTEGSEMVITVADRGPGLPPDSLERVFDKFYRAPGAATGGTGLGLSICKGLVEAHGGTIRAENRANGGTRFIVRLPIASQPELPRESAAV
ncbi:MAG: sensor histidine kinase KdpD [Anaerolineae bacterium]|nr:sensor histidine kinase KdpD [Anaerolineae bacterium]